MTKLNTFNMKMFWVREQQNKVPALELLCAQFSLFCLIISAVFLQSTGHYFEQ